MDKENALNTKAKQQPQLSPSSKRRRLICEPDVTVVVGGVEFEHHGPMLCMVSEYFDAALNSGMKETATKRIEFPDKDPAEWEALTGFFVPVHSPNAGSVTPENVLKLLPWFDFLQMSHLLEVSEKCLREAVFPNHGTTTEPCSRYIAKLQRKIAIGSCATGSQTLERLRSEVSLICSTFGTCVHYHFTKLQQELTTHLVRIIGESPDFFTQESVESLVATLVMASNMDLETKTAIWEALQVYLPPHILQGSTTTTTDHLTALWNSPLLSSLIFMGMESFVVKSRNRLLPQVLVDEVLLRGGPRLLSGAEVKRGLTALLSKFPGLLNNEEVDGNDSD